MGDLPPDRVAPVAPFLKSGVVKRGNPRKPTICKVYIALFICLSTKAVHLETCTDLSTSAFMSTLRRFVTRRGMPQLILSDNSRNFVGAAKEISELMTFLKSGDLRQGISHFCTENHLRWEFIPPCTPHHGGLWETAVKSMKTLIHKIVGEHQLTHPQLDAVLAEVEATMNSRPLLPLQVTDEEGPSLLTPGHFLIGRPLRALPTRADNISTKVASLWDWNLTKRLTSDIWKMWHQTYVQSLQARNKWAQAYSQCDAEG